ncbi:hypothetical protein SZN_23581 [Streptomyces zinciresistens K42]|uniref:DUF3592 domain-containing protein n=1 Tax=Streptomyces zinciresistens K42 TaxID=700597 RepID=G2GGT2_9ACTN|nr:DUF3592 domain-containing protein [Streptomyces zinciresistens]EGX57278.1 hypothetical protein SZN_23581 [Streptomyces zinciresistens K42]
MGWNVYLVLWCGVFGAVALTGYVRSLAGMTRAQRTVRTTGRIERVDEPRHGSSPKDGIAVVVSFQDPATGEEFTVTNDGERGERVGVAWTGREIGVHYPPGRPHAFRFADHPSEGGRGLGWPAFALFLVYAGPVTVAAVERGWPWALVGFCGPWALYAAYHLPGNVRDRNRRIDALDAMAAVPGRVVAVLKSVSTDDDGHTSTHLVPVVSFTTLDGRAVTAYCESALPDPAGSRGLDVTIHYTPHDPAVFVLDVEAERRSWKRDMAVNVVGVVIIAAAAVAGVIAW